MQKKSVGFAENFKFLRCPTGPRSLELWRMNPLCKPASSREVFEKVGIVSESYDDETYILWRQNWLFAAKKYPESIAYTVAMRDGDVESELALAKKNPVLPDLYEDEGPCRSGEYQSYLRLAALYLNCIKENQTYSSYCTARRDSQSDLARQIEMDSPGIAERFDDFGDIYTASLSAREWVLERFYLFLPMKIDTVGDENTVGITSIPGVDGSILVDATFKSLWESPFSEKGTPKYRIGLVGGKRTYAESYQYCIEAAQVWSELQFETLDKVTDDFYYRTEFFEGVGIERPDRNTSANELGSVDDIEAKKSTIKRRNKFYKNCIDTAVSGVFPPK